MTCKCMPGALCPKCQKLSAIALKRAQVAGPAGAMQAYYEELEKLRKEARDAEKS